MKSIILSFILSILCYTAVFAQSNELPSIEKEWTIKDYKSFTVFLDGLSLDSYPNLKDEKTKAVFQKLVATDYKAILNDTAINGSVKIPYALNYLQNVREVLEKYFIANTKGYNYGIEFMHLQGTTLNISAEMIPVLIEFVKTLDKNDEKYQARMNGLKQLKFGLKQQLDGAFIIIKDRENSSDEERIILSEYLVDVAANILNFLDASDKKEFKAKIVAYLPIEPNEKVKALLNTLVAKL